MDWPRTYAVLDALREQAGVDKKDTPDNLDYEMMRLYRLSEYEREKNSGVDPSALPDEQT